jgi:nucleoside-triphosphatase
MKLLLTGMPGTGKTTLVKEIVASIDDCFYVVSEEIRDDGNNRIGFKGSNSSGQSEVFAHKTAIDSEKAIGEYKVDIAAVNRLFSLPISQTQQQMVVIDEIGRMEMLSPAFKKAVDKLFDKDTSLLATIRHGDDWTRQYTDRSDVIIFELTNENYEKIAECLKSTIRSNDVVDKLTAAQKDKINELARQYLKTNKYIQLKKLFDNAVAYVHEHRVTKINDNSYDVAGNHNIHKINKIDNKWRCDCDLFNGRGKYAGNPGVCSHIQAVSLSVE